MKFRKKPVVIDAINFQCPIEIKNGVITPGQMFIEWPVEMDEQGCFLTIPTLEGNHRANYGD